MTRLTDDDVKGISDSLQDVNDMLTETTGMSLIELAYEAVNVTTAGTDVTEFTVGVVPVTSGMGVITRFSESVADICRSMGMESFVTKTYDIKGLAEALSQSPDIVFMADDYEFIAYNTKARRHANNSQCTAAGYVTALNGAAKGLIGKTVLVLGAGRVGGWAAGLLSAKGANVILADIDIAKAEAVASRFAGAVATDRIGEAIASNDLIINSSPAHVESRYIREGAIISSPGVPHTFDEEAYRKATIIHDPLSIGVAVMAVMSSSFYIQDIKKCRR